MTKAEDAYELFKAAVGEVEGTGEWFLIDQDRINAFADATGDHQWIHVDPARAASGPFGSTVAHGYLTLSLLIPLWTDILTVYSAHTKVNYGLGKVRFPAPVPTGSRLRLIAELAAFDDVPGGAQLTIDATIERDGGDKPVCVAEWLVRYYPN